MEQSKFEYYYNEIAKWHLVSCPPGFWGSDEYISNAWNMAYEENVKELKEAIVSSDDIKLLDMLCDGFWTLVALLEVYNNPILEGNHKTPSTGLINAPKYCSLAAPIISQQQYQHLYYLMSVLTRWMDQIDLPVEDGMAAVFRSNWTKFPLLSQILEQYGDNQEEALKAASDYIETKWDCEGVYGSIVDVGEVKYCVFRDKDHKIRKPFTYVEPGLEVIMKKFREERGV